MVCVVLHGHDDAVFDLSRFESNGSTSACGADLAARAVLMARVCWLIVACFVPDMVSYVAQQFGLLKEADRLRPEQENVLDAWARRKSSTFHVDRTGGGKSLVYSLAHPLGLVNGKLVIIVPLNALARDVERRLAPVAESLGANSLLVLAGRARDSETDEALSIKDVNDAALDAAKIIVVIPEVCSGHDVARLTHTERTSGARAAPSRRAAGLLVRRHVLLDGEPVSKHGDDERFCARRGASLCQLGHVSPCVLSNANMAVVSRRVALCAVPVSDRDRGTSTPLFVVWCVL